AQGTFRSQCSLFSQHRRAGNARNSLVDESHRVNSSGVRFHSPPSVCPIREVHSETPHLLQHHIVESRQVFMPIVRINSTFLLTLKAVVDRKLGGGGTNHVHEADQQRRARFHPFR